MNILLRLLLVKSRFFNSNRELGESAQIRYDSGRSGEFTMERIGDAISVSRNRRLSSRMKQSLPN